jgi:hypothetical protein
LFGFIVDLTGSYTQSWGLLMVSQLLGIVLLGWVRTAPVPPRVIAADGTHNSHPRRWWGMTAAASTLAVAGIVGLLLSIYAHDFERGPRGLVQRTRRLLAISDVETAQQPTAMGPSPAVPALSAAPPAAALDSLTPAPTAMTTPTGEVAALPEAPPSDKPPLTSAANTSVVQTVAQDLGRPLEIATSETAQSAESSRTSQSRTGPSRAAGIPTAQQTAAGSETSRSAEASGPAAGASSMSKRDLLPPATAHPAGRMRPCLRVRPRQVPRWQNLSKPWGNGLRQRREPPRAVTIA